jgi:sterol-4alpha-carboxylate 3-dehydrogenase (decarboxylating)
MASLVDWGTHGEEEVYSINVDGTRNVIAACREKQVKALVYTSSLDAIFSGKPTRDVDESIAYPARYPNIYCESKAEAEKLVCTANGEQLQTVCLRPADIFGEGDPFHIGSLIAMARKGFYVRIGDGTAKNQHVYVGNVAHAHIQAADAIMNGNKAPCGNVYFITDAPPSNFFSFFDYIIEQAGYRIRPGNVWIPRWLMYCIGSLVEFIAFLLRPFHRFNPKVSRFAVTYTCTDFTFSSEQARKDFHFLPKYSHQEALERTITYYAATRDS